MWRAGTRRSGSGRAQAGFSTAARQRQIKTGKPANNPLSSKRAGAHLHCRWKGFRATQAHRPAATQLRSEPGVGGRPPPPPAPNTQGAPGAGAAMNSSAGAGRVPRHGNSIGTAGRGAVNNSGAPLAHTMPRKDEACSHRLEPPRPGSGQKAVREWHPAGGAPRSRESRRLGEPCHAGSSPACPRHQRERSAGTLHSTACSPRTHSSLCPAGKEKPPAASCALHQPGSQSLKQKRLKAILLQLLLCPWKCLC